MSNCILCKLSVRGIFEPSIESKAKLVNAKFWAAPLLFASAHAHTKILALLTAATPVLNTAHTHTHTHTHTPHTDRAPTLTLLLTKARAHVLYTLRPTQ